jgi:cation-transporting P-type ATPase C
MFLKSLKKPLLGCDILHSLTGRVRIGCLALRYLTAYQKEIENRLESDFAIISASVNPLSENVLIYFDVKKSNVKEIFDITSHINLIGKNKTARRFRKEDCRKNLSARCWAAFQLMPLPSFIPFLENPLPPARFSEN